MSYKQVVVVPASAVPTETVPQTPKRIGEVLLEKADELYPECAEELKEAVKSGNVKYSQVAR